MDTVRRLERCQEERRELAAQLALARREIQALRREAVEALTLERETSSWPA